MVDQDVRPTETSESARVQRVAVLALDGAYPFELGIPSRVFEAADRLYEVATCSADARPVTSASDVTIGVAHGPELLDDADIVVISSVVPECIPTEFPDAVTAALHHIPPTARIVSICTGAFFLATAGLLDNRMATTHWQLTENFRERFPQVTLDPDVLFVADGRILTSAGAASGVDACLHIIRDDHGRDVANTAARRCVVPPFRDGGQAQYIEQPVPDSSLTGTAQARNWALAHMNEQLDLTALARRAAMSPRTFSRRFTAEVGVSPGRWIVRQRVAQAQRLLETTDLTVEQIAGEVGFATGASLRQHFQAAIGVSPIAYRHTFAGNT